MVTLITGASPKITEPAAANKEKMVTVIFGPNLSASIPDGIYIMKYA
jgi:hypothetical protein